MMASNGSTNESVMGSKLPSARVHELSQLQCKGVMPRARATSICVEAETTVSHMTMRWGGGQDEAITADEATLATARTGSGGRVMWG